MTDEITQPSAEPEAVQTLDDVISEFNIEPSPQTMAPTEPKPVEYTQPQFNPVDPLDSDQWNHYQQQQSQHQAALQGQLQEVSSKLEQYEQERINQRVQTDIKAAVETISKQVEEGDPMMIELYLEKEAREKPGFKSIWHNREANPKALDKALKAISNDLKGKFSVKADPQLTENQRAIQQSQQSSSTSNQPTYANSIEESLGGAQSEAEWERAWEQAIRGG